MDRLLCGDVGYGKTEVAMRAAFKALADSKQVAVLAPTTVLVFQHYETFRRRMAAFPVRVEMLSRFRSAREQKKILAGVEKRARSISSSARIGCFPRTCSFHDLGLLVVDEEQRFGVTHKERLKEMSRNVDVLTLTATPIPRTLNMSLVGLRDMSVIETPPKDRLAIQTVVAPFSEGTGAARPSRRRSSAAARSSSCTTASNPSTRWRAWCKSWCPRRAWWSATARWASTNSRR